MTDRLKPWGLRIIAAAAAVVAGVVWTSLRPDGLPEGFATGNGRIEAVEIDVAAKIAGRVADVLVNEGDFVHRGDELARMDTAVLQAQAREAEAQLKRAVIGITVARSQVNQRTAEKEAAAAVIAQAEAELDAARKRLQRTEELEARGTASIQKLDDDRAGFQATRAALNAARAKLAAAEAAIALAEAEVVGAEHDVAAVQATIERIQADIADSVLRAPRDGRVQYRVAQPGEVVGAGGTVLNMVDLGDVSMTFFLPTAAAGRLAVGAEARIVLDAAPQYVIPAEISFVSDVAQFTPKTVETTAEREKLMFRVKARIPAELLRRYIRLVKTGLPGVAHVRVLPRADWPAGLQVRLPDV